MQVFIDELTKEEMISVKLTGLLILILMMLPMIQAATTATTNFAFNVPTNRGHTITYDGACTSGAFFFNEIDANFDPDVDGNAARVKPSSVRRNNTTFTITDYNYAGTNAPADRNVAYDGSLAAAVPTDNNSPSGEFTTTDYTEVSTDDTSYQLTTNTGDIPEPIATQRFVFKINVHEQVVRDINFVYLGQALENNGSCSAGAGGDSDINIYIWNYNTSAYTALTSHTGTGQGIGAVIPKYLEGFVSGDVTPYISADNNVTILVRGTVGAGDTRCLFTDLVNLKTTQYQQSDTTFCQSSTLAPMTVTNVGNVSINLDGNFSSTFAGVDKNLILKVWRGTGSGCGTDGNGLGGWQDYCGVTTYRPEARWEFNYDANASRFADSSGNGHHGTFVGTADKIQPPNCADENCLQKLHLYDLNVQNGVTFMDDNFTIATWVYFDSASTDTSNILTTRNSTGATALVNMEIDQDIDQLICTAGTAVSTFYSYDGGTLDNAWHQIGCTRKIDGNVVIYLDGTWGADSIQTTGDLDLVGAGNAYFVFARGVGDTTLKLDRSEIYTVSFDANEMNNLFQMGRATPDDWRTNTPSQTTCRQYDWTNADAVARLATSLAAGDTNQLCFSGDFNAFVNAGDHNKTFVTGANTV